MSTINESEKNNTVKSKKKIRKGPKVLGTLILLAVIIAGLWFGVVRGIDAIGYVGTDDASMDGKQVNLSSRMLGRINKIDTSEGSEVNSGEILISLDTTDMMAQEAQAQASLVYARQNLVLAKINLDKTRDDSSRMRNLYDNGAATRESFEHAVSALNSAQAQYNLAQAQVDTPLAQLGVIEAQLLNTVIRSPLSGTVDKITLSEGDVVQPGQTILSVSNLDDLWINANLEETKISRVSPGARVRITIDALGHQEFEGVVEKIQTSIVAPAFQIGEFTKTTKRIPVKIRFKNLAGTAAELPDGVKLLPGMSAVVKIRTQTPLPAFLEK